VTCLRHPRYAAAAQAGSHLHQLLRHSPDCQQLAYAIGPAALLLQH
jgi:hypothetical protein